MIKKKVRFHSGDALPGASPLDPPPRPTHLTSSSTGKALARGWENSTRICRDSGGAAESPAKRWTFTLPRSSTDPVRSLPSPCGHAEGKRRRPLEELGRHPSPDPAEGTGQGRPYRAAFLPKLHGQGRPQPPSAEGPPAGAAAKGQGQQGVGLGTRGGAQR